MASFSTRRLKADFLYQVRIYFFNIKFLKGAGYNVSNSIRSPVTG